VVDLMPPVGRPVARRGAAALAAALLIVWGAAGAPRGDAAPAVTPGVAAGGVPLNLDVYKVLGLLGRPSVELQDPTNPHIYIQRWEERCLGARYTPEGTLLALDVWADLGEQCGAAGAYGADGADGRRITFESRRADVKAAFGDRPGRVLRGPAFTVFVYDDQGIAFYVRDEGLRAGLVDAMTVFPRGTSRAIWRPVSWGGR
jgi:hypothetical protein